MQRIPLNTSLLLLAAALQGFAWCQGCLRAFGSKKNPLCGHRNALHLGNWAECFQQYKKGSMDPDHDSRVQMTAFLESTFRRNDIHEDNRLFDQDSRVFPAFVVDKVQNRALLVVGVGVLGIKDLGLVQQLSVEAEDLLVFGVLRVLRCLRRCHGLQGVSLSRSCLHGQVLQVHPRGKSRKEKGFLKTIGLTCNEFTASDVCFGGSSRYVKRSELALRERDVDGLAALRIPRPGSWHLPAASLASLPRVQAPSGASTPSEAPPSTPAQLHLDGSAPAPRLLSLFGLQSLPEAALRQESVQQVSCSPYCASSRASSGERGDHFALDSHVRVASLFFYIPISTTLLQHALPRICTQGVRNTLMLHGQLLLLSHCTTIAYTSLRFRGVSEVAILTRLEGNDGPKSARLCNINTPRASTATCPFPWQAKSLFARVKPTALTQDGGRLHHRRL